MVHAATYYAHGLRPFTDFPCSMPPFFMAGIRFATLVLGLKWASFAVLSAAFAALTFVWMYLLLMSNGIAQCWALAIASVVELSTMFLAPFWWFNNTTSVAVVLLFLSVLACASARASIGKWASLVLSLAMVLTAKPNAAPAVLMIMALFLIRGDHRRVKVLGCCLAATVLAVTICYAAQMPPIAIVRSYLEIGKLRGSPLAMLPIREMSTPERYFQVLLIAVTLLWLIKVLVSSARAKRQPWAVYAICAVAFLTSLEMSLTNSEIKPTDLCVALVAIAVLELDQAGNNGKRLGLTVLLSIFLVMSLYFGCLHLRINAIGERVFYEPLPTQTIRSGFFDGLEAAPRLQRIMLQTQEALSLYPSNTVFFGPRMEFEYAVFGEKPLAGMPLLWDTGNFYSRDRIPEFLNAFRENDPDILILFKHHSYGMDAVALYLLTTPTYERVESFSEITVFVRHREVPLSDVDPMALMKRCSAIPGCVKR